MTRSAVLEVMREDFVRTARAKGLSRRAVLWRHVLRNAMIPVLTIMGLQFANLITGTIVVENVFVLPGHRPAGVPGHRQPRPGGGARRGDAAGGDGGGRQLRRRRALCAWSIPRLRCMSASRRMHRASDWSRARRNPSFVIGARAGRTAVRRLRAAVAGVDALAGGRDRHPQQAGRRRAPRTGSAPTAWAATSPRSCWSARATRSSSASSRCGIGLVVGVALGCLAAARRGWVEELVMRASDFTFAFPALLSAIMLSAIYGPGLVTGIVAIGIFNIPVFARTTRAAANAVWARDYVLAARAAGTGPWRITLDHVLPNIASVLIVQATIQFATGHPRRGGAVLPGPGHAAAAAELGPHAQRGADADVPGAAAGDLPRRGDRAGGAGPEPDGRRPARPARPEAGAAPLIRACRPSRSGGA